jgi:hypothetical protein
VPNGNTVAAAVAALGVPQIPDTKAAAAIVIDRKSAYPNEWAVTVPPRSVLAAERIRDVLNEHADDLRTLARRIDHASRRKH